MCNGKLRLVNESSLGDRGWKSKFFYVNKESMGEARDWITGSWNRRVLLCVLIFANSYYAFDIFLTSFFLQILKYLPLKGF